MENSVLVRFEYRGMVDRTLENDRCSDEKG